MKLFNIPQVRIRLPHLIQNKKTSPSPGSERSSDTAGSARDAVQNRIRLPCLSKGNNNSTSPSSESSPEVTDVAPEPVQSRTRRLPRLWRRKLAPPISSRKPSSEAATAAPGAAQPPIRLPRLFRRKKTSPASSSEPSSEVTDAVLDTVHGAIRITSAFGDWIGIPAVKGALETATMVIELIKTIRSNRADCKGLTEQVERYCQILETSVGYEEEDFAGADFLACIFQLSESLRETHKALQKIARRNLLHRTVCAMSDQKRVADCKEKLANGFQAFQLASQCVQERHFQRMRQSLSAVQAHIQAVQTGQQAIELQVEHGVRDVRHDVRVLHIYTNARLQDISSRLDVRQIPITHIEASLEAARGDVQVLQDANLVQLELKRLRNFFLSAMKYTPSPGSVGSVRLHLLSLLKPS